MVRSPLRRSRSSSRVDIDFPLKKVFGKHSFRPLQREIIQSAIDGDDIFVQAATSFGKSLCFQLPAWCSKGVTVVISPLLALVQNQVNAANGFGIPAHSIQGSTPFLERKKIEADLLCGHPHTKLCYVTPELCQTDNFRRILLRLHQQGQLVRVAIDEAHCISEWGHDFRPAYKELKWLKQNLQCPSVPIIALTATATPKVKQDIYRYLGLKEDRTVFFSTSIARPNIHYEVQYFSEINPQDTSGDDQFAYLLAWLVSIHQRRVRMLRHLLAQGDAGTTDPAPPRPASSASIVSGIIYANSRAMTETLANKLQSSGISCQSYHAGLQDAQRAKVQDDFMQRSKSSGTANEGNASNTDNIENSFNLITATNAFGMGIDMPSVRFVVHYGFPRNFESFIQESGRAGRDDKAAQSLVLYSREAKERALFRVKQDITKDLAKRNKQGFVATQAPEAQADFRMSSFWKVVEYCETTKDCRHKLISEYFTGPSQPRTMQERAERMKEAASSRTLVQPTVCDYACDICKEGPEEVKKRMNRGLATEEQASQTINSPVEEYY